MEEHKAHRPAASGPKAAKKARKTRPADMPRGNNAKAFAIQSVGKTRRRVAHTMEKFVTSS